MSSGLSFEYTNRLSKQLRIDNYLYQHNNTINGKFYWNGKESQKVGPSGFKCTSNCTMSGNNETDRVIGYPTEHNHEPYRDSKIEMIDFKAKIKKR